MPGLESSNNNKEVEDKFYNKMMIELLEIVLKPYFDKNVSTGIFQFESENNWIKVKDKYEDSDTNSDKTYLNLFNWKAFTQKNKSKILIL